LGFLMVLRFELRASHVLPHETYIPPAQGFCFFKVHLS
jgi:hypothetical protein